MAGKIQQGTSTPAGFKSDKPKTPAQREESKQTSKPIDSGKETLAKVDAKQGEVSRVGTNVQADGDPTAEKPKTSQPAESKLDTGDAKEARKVTDNYPLPTAEELAKADARYKKGYDTGYDNGLHEGRVQGSRAGREHAEGQAQAFGIFVDMGGRREPLGWVKSEQEAADYIANRHAENKKGGGTREDLTYVPLAKLS